MEKAFFAAKLPFSQDWQRTPANPYLVPKQTPAAVLPRAYRGHLLGTAAYTNSSTFRIRTVYLFDTSATATSYATWLKHHCTCGDSIALTARNAVYQGSRFPALAAVMARLRR